MPKVAVIAREGERRSVCTLWKFVLKCLCVCNCANIAGQSRLVVVTVKVMLLLMMMMKGSNQPTD